MKSSDIFITYHLLLRTHTWVFLYPRMKLIYWWLTRLSHDICTFCVDKVSAISHGSRWNQILCGGFSEVGQLRTYMQYVQGTCPGRCIAILKAGLLIGVIAMKVDNCFDPLFCQRWATVVLKQSLEVPDLCSMHNRLWCVAQTSMEGSLDGIKFLLCWVFSPFSQDLCECKSCLWSRGYVWFPSPSCS